MHQPLVSIIVPVYNNAADLRATIECALNQTWQNKEILIIDDGSTDDSLAIARSYEGTKNSFTVISVENGGASKARNIGFNHSKGDYIQYLDADDLLVNNKIELQMNRLLSEADPRSVLCTGQWIRFKDAIDDTIGGIGPGGEAEMDMDPLEWLLLRPYNFMTVHAWLTPRELVQKAGPWNEAMTLDDDGEFFTRVVNASEKIIFCKGALTYYRTLITTASLSKASSFNHSDSNCRKLLSAYTGLETYKKVLSSYRHHGIRKAIGENMLNMAFTSYGVCDEVYDKCIQQKEIPFMQRIVVYKWITGKFGLLALLIGWRNAKKIMIKKYSERSA